MGEFLSQPNKEKHSFDDENPILNFFNNNVYIIRIVKIWFI